MTINRYAAYSDYCDNYSEDWSNSGSAALFSTGSSSWNPSRMPGYPTFTLGFEQASDHTAGAQIVTQAPYLQEMLIQLTWHGMSGLDRTTLFNFLLTYDVQLTTGTFRLFNPMIGPALPVRLASDTVPRVTEMGYDRFQVTLTLRVELNYPQSEFYDDLPGSSNNLFVCGSAAFNIPPPLRSTTGNSLRMPQTLERNSSGTPIVYRKGAAIFYQHQYAMALNWTQFINLQAFFFSFTHGGQMQFIWVDSVGGMRFVHLSGNNITVKQTHYDRYECELNLLEEG